MFSKIKNLFTKEPPVCEEPVPLKMEELFSTFDGAITAYCDNILKKDIDSIALKAMKLSNIDPKELPVISMYLSKMIFMYYEIRNGYMSMEQLAEIEKIVKED
jgi:hypothetical protein